MCKAPFGKYLQKRQRDKAGKGRDQKSGERGEGRQGNKTGNCEDQKAGKEEKIDREIKAEKLAGDEKETISVQSEEDEWGEEEEDEIGKSSRRSSRSTVRVKRDPDCTRYVALSASSGTLSDSCSDRAQSPPPGTYSGVEEKACASPGTPKIYAEMADEPGRYVSARNRERSTVARRGRRSRSTGSNRRSDRATDTRLGERTQTTRWQPNRDTPRRRQGGGRDQCVQIGQSSSPNYVSYRSEYERKNDMRLAGRIDGGRYLDNQDIHTERSRGEGSPYAAMESHSQLRKPERGYRNLADAPTTSIERSPPAIRNNDQVPRASNRRRFPATASLLTKHGLSERNQDKPRINHQKSQSIESSLPYAAIQTDRSLGKRAIEEREGYPPGNKSGVDSGDRGIGGDSPNARNREVRRGRKRGRRCRVSYADAVKTVTCYRANCQRDLEEAEEIWRRLEDPSIGGEGDPLHGFTEKAIWYAKKGKEFIELSKKYGTSKAAQVLRSDARRLGGPVICTTDPEAAFDDAVSNFCRRRKWKPTKRHQGRNGGSISDTSL